MLLETVNTLAKDDPLPRRYFDHSLGGEWNDHRDCDIRPDLILINRKPDDASLELGSNRRFDFTSNSQATPHSVFRHNEVVGMTL